MRLLSLPELEEPHDCAYFSDLSCCRFRFFFADNVKSEELDILLAGGWRKFSRYYFRPECAGCARCIPIRIPVKDFRPSKSQRRVLNDCADFMVNFSPLKYSDEIYEIYRDHKETRFNGWSDREDFIASFYSPSCPAIQSEYYLNGILAGVGFIDMGAESLSSVYMIYSSPFAKYRPGTFSVLKEIEFAAEKGMDYYYLGYYIADNRSMAYKNRFYPHEIFDWESKKWMRIEKR